MIIDRFEGEGGKRALIDTLERNRLVLGDRNLASELVAEGSLKVVAEGDVVIEEGAGDNAIYFIVAGEFDVLVKGKQVALRSGQDTVGEMGALDPSMRRSAAVSARSEGVLLEVSSEKFHSLGDQFPAIWKALSIDLGRRLTQRNKLVERVNDEIRVFIISSSESLDIAREIQSSLSHEDGVLVTLWTDGVFKPSEHSMESLEAELDASDFAIAIAAPDDQTTSREKTQMSPRDNVVFELGFFMGRLSRSRTFLVTPQDGSLKIPSDLIGINTVRYESGPPDRLTPLLAPACNEIRKSIRKLGART